MPGLVCKEIKDNGIALAALTECIKSGVESEESSPELVEIDLEVAAEVNEFYVQAHRRLEKLAKQLFIFPDQSPVD